MWHGCHWKVRHLGAAHAVTLSRSERIHTLFPPCSRLLHKPSPLPPVIDSAVHRRPQPVLPKCIVSCLSLHTAFLPAPITCCWPRCHLLHAARSYLLVEFWQLDGAAAAAATAQGNSSAASPPSAAADVRVFAARGTQPWVTVGPDGHIKVTPPLLDMQLEATSLDSGSFQDADAVVYGRTAARLLLPAESPTPDIGEPLDPNAWCVRHFSANKQTVCKDTA
jgi:hypothetical protein